MKSIRLWFVGFAVLIGTFLTFPTLDQYKKNSNPNVGLEKANPCVVIGNVCYDLERATTNQQRIKGLSGRDNMPEKDGMLFVFDTPDEQCMWMKDMKISNDMIWLDANKRVVQVKENISPETYPETFCSSVPAQYVIELNAGQVAKNGLHLGDTVSF